MGTPESGRVTMDTDGHFCTITVDNIAKKNAYTPAMLDQVAEFMTTFEDDDDLWVAIFCSAGEHTTAGLDMPRFFGPTAEPNHRRPGLVDPFGLERRCTKPVIAVVQGITYTVGIEMALAQDIVIAADTARFQQLESRRGIAPLGGAHFRYISRVGWGNAMYHLFLCDEFTAAEAHRIGMVQEVVPAGQQVDRAMELAGIIAKNAPLGIQVTKEAGRRFIEAGEQAAIGAIAEISARVLDSEDAKEGIQSFVERRAAAFTGR
jgi:enoyl-CoA hydratase